MNSKTIQISIIKLLFIAFISFIAFDSSAQRSDTTLKKSPKNDTLSVYKKIRKVAYKRKFTKFLYHAIFVDPAPLKYDKKPLSDKQKKLDPFLKYKGNVIRSVTIIVLDPFGYSANDTNQTMINPLQRVGNRAHIVTQKRIIRNLLLFKKDETVDLVKISETERLLRAARYIRDARIYLTSPSKGSDSVDITVIVHDKWTLDPTVSISSTGGKLRLRDRNLGGLGQTYEQRYGYSVNTGHEFKGNYYFSNIKNTYITSDVFYVSTKLVNQIGVNFDRSFYSLLTKFAGGVSLIKTWSVYQYYDTLQPLLLSERMDYFSSDFWLASAYSPNTGKGINRPGSKIIGAVRYADTRFQSRPSWEIDTGRSNANSALYLGSIGYSLRKYYKDQYIYRFGANEDVPEGFVVQVLYGYLTREESKSKYYTGFEISRGKHYDKVGYLSGDLAIGSLYNKGEKNNTTLNAGLFYFTDLSLERKWYIRQFVTFKYVKGFNKSFYERITLKSEEMYGFRSGLLTGTSKMILNLETVMYAPYNFIGFKFAPVAFLGFGMLGTYNTKLLKSPVYQSYAVGVLVRNESLLNSSFEITFGMYPNQPGYGYTVFKLNPVTTFTLKVRSFAISKPGTVGFE